MTHGLTTPPLSRPSSSISLDVRKHRPSCRGSRAANARSAPFFASVCVPMEPFLEPFCSRRSPSGGCASTAPFSDRYRTRCAS